MKLRTKLTFNGRSVAHSCERGPFKAWGPGSSPGRNSLPSRVAHFTWYSSPGPGNGTSPLVRDPRQDLLRLPRAIEGMIRKRGARRLSCESHFPGAHHDRSNDGGSLGAMSCTAVSRAVMRSCQLFLQ